MAKKHNKGRSQRKTPLKSAAVQPSPQKGIWRVLQILSPTGLFWATVSLIAALISSYFLLRPQIEVEPDIAIDPKQPMTTPFRITNRGVLPIYNVHKECGITKLNTGENGQPQVNLFKFSFRDTTDPYIPRLDEGESTSVLIRDGHFPFIVPGKPFECGDIDVVVEYTTAIIGFRKKQSFRFETRRDVNNEVRWYHKASSE